MQIRRDPFLVPIVKYRVCTCLLKYSVVQKVILKIPTILAVVIQAIFLISVIDLDNLVH